MPFCISFFLSRILPQFFFVSRSSYLYSLHFNFLGRTCCMFLPFFPLHQLQYSRVSLHVVLVRAKQSAKEDKTKEGYTLEHLPNGRFFSFFFSFQRFKRDSAGSVVFQKKTRFFLYLVFCFSSSSSFSCCCFCRRCFCCFCYCSPPSFSFIFFFSSFFHCVLPVCPSLPR